MKKCLLFDCDGTLVDSEHICNLGLSDMFLKFGVALSPDDLVMRFRGGKLANIINTIANEHSLTLPDTFVAEYRDSLTQLYEDHLSPIEGVSAALDKLEHVKAVVSNGPRAKVEHALEVCNLTHFFNEKIFSAYDIQSWKPDPSIYMYAAKKIGFQPEDCVVIEDSTSGVEAGLSAGMTTLFYNPNNSATVSAEAIAFESMKDLPKVIENLS